MSYGQDLALTLPQVGIDTFAEGATLVNTALQALIDVVEAKVNPSGMDINATLSFKSGAVSNAATDLLKIAMTPGVLLAAGIHPASAFVSSVDGEWYLNDNNGNQVKLTAAGSVNAPLGNITGAGYGAGGVEVNWDSGNVAYRMRSGAGPNSFADIVVNEIRMDEGSHEYRLTAPGITADQGLTFPLRPVSGSSLLAMSSAGVIVASDAITPSSGTIAVTGAVTATSTMLATEHLYSQLDTLLIDASAAINIGSSAVVNSGHTTISSGDGLIFPVQLRAGERILKYHGSGKHVSGASGFQVSLHKRTFTSDVVTQLGVTQTSGTVGGTYYNPNEAGLTETTLADTHYYVVVTTQGAGVADITGVRVEVDRPV